MNHRHRHLSLNRRGIALAVVMSLVTCALLFAGGMFFFRKEVKQQNVVNINFLQANFLAQGAIQHALLKVKMLPQEAFDAGMIQTGLCPFRGVVAGSTEITGGPHKSDIALETYRSDANTNSRPWNVAANGFIPANWNYTVASFTVISASADPAKKELVQMIRIVARGTVNDPKGGRGNRVEEMVKTIEVRRPQ
jgi:hypothetical protein